MRLRVECLLLSAGGMKVPQLAVHLDCCEATVRTLLHRFAEEGVEVVHPQPPGFAPDLARRQRIEEALDRFLRRPQAWTVTTLSQALAAEEDIHLKPRTVRMYLKRMGATWRRTHATVRHKQDPNWRPRRERRWRDSKKVPGRGAGPSSPSTRPASAPPCRPPTPGPRRACAQSSPTRTPEGRDVNVLAALAAPGTHKHAPLTWRTASHPWKGEHVLAFLRQALPGRAGVPRLVVFDNAGIHRSRRCAKPVGHWRSRGSGSGTCRPTAPS